MTTCLLCHSPVVADGLCVPCGARLWAAIELVRHSNFAVYLLGRTSKEPMSDYWEPRRVAILELRTPEAGQAFLARLDAARAERKRVEDERGIQ